jgi:hypothetical protein
MRVTNFSIYLVLIFAIISCKKEGAEGKKSLIDLLNEPIGANCSSGGFKVVTGVDLNGNNLLEENEVQNTTYICNGNTGSAGLNSFVNLLNEPAGINCSSGGYKVISGTDLNENNNLDENEVQNTDYICNGDDGAAGINSLVNLIDEPAGTNCTSGGFKVLSGTDLNGNNILDENEIQNTEYLCNGVDGGYDKEIIVDLIGNFVYDNTIYTYPMEYHRIKDFDITNYLNADSIAFQTYLNVRFATGTVTVELYDFTNLKPIANTVLIGSSTTNIWTTTKTNFINDLPKTPITLGIRGKISSTSVGFGTTVSPRLVIYRKQ